MIKEVFHITKHSTFRLKEKQEERGSVQTLGEISYNKSYNKIGGYYENSITFYLF